MKYSLVLFVLLFPISIYGQRKFNQPTIQNFYTTCKAQKYSAFNLTNTGIQVFGSRQYSRSLNKFRSAVEKDPEFCDAWYLIGYAHQQRGELQEAIEACNKSIEINSNSLSAYIISGYTNLLLEDSTEAVANFEKAKELDPKLIDGYYGLALINYWNGDKEAVQNEFFEFQSNKGKEVEGRDERTFEDLVAAAKKLDE